MADTNNRIDELESLMVGEYPTVDCPVKHLFVPGMYIREIFMPKGEEGNNTLITSLIHKTMHPFFILKGKVSVFSDTAGEQVLEAPHIGVTMPGTRRVLMIHSDCVWATCHLTSIQPENESAEAVEEAVRLIGEQIIEQRENTLLGGMLKNNKIIPLTLGNNINKLQ